MSILQKLHNLSSTKEKLVLTTNEYQDLCLEVFLLDNASDYDELILTYRLNGEEVTIEETL